ncbi:MAG: hypothetical protein IKL10_03555 [Clostridia bacterium]|nr:hypothetical protein [Clostridia bacterium]
MKIRKTIAFLLAALLIVAALPLSVSAAEYPAAEEIEYIFHDMGFVTWGDGYFGCHMMNPDGDDVPDRVAHEYIQLAGKLKDYSFEEPIPGDDEHFMYGYSLSYDDYIAIIDECFVNHSDMKAYLTNEWNNYYDEATNTVKWYTGGYGGPADWIVDNIYYSSENLVYATGKFVEYGYEDSYFDGMEENWDYIIMGDGDDSYKAEINDCILLGLQYVDGEWKILEYRENSYHIVDNVLYEVLDREVFDRLVIESGNAKVEAYEESVDFTWGFVANGNKWYTDGSELSYEIETAEGYELVSVVLKDDNGTKEIKAVDGVYTISPKGFASLTVNTAKIPTVVAPVSPEITEIKVSENKTDIYVVEGQSIAEITEALAGDTEILKADGSKAAADDKIASGMQIVLKDKEGKTIDTKTVVVPGDIDGDAKVNSEDARSALRASVELDKLDGWRATAANVNGGTIKAEDARLILRASVELEDAADWLPNLI